ncbi:hypothetical protein M406DRAFT_76195 [Cryphonectria parasitica EP155]|uniref:Fucose-specific lectin n=1 Tax=Cryphonectria parasitica (strain ATCC 38755 / EP155) TaxID=660469 RepID=A0A9P4XWG8_CRYP1|nr:uncharacterized protein M406DRAFT_76195 [Cryphonectria parasitica EP155]KAF3762116.1 hypothetical protein M406DRAFT_76195 [Cryphonectria parasitica EP155]
MDSYTIRVKNQSSKARTYTVCSEEVYILESAKNMLVSPIVNPGMSCDIIINDKFYVWAKLTGTSSQKVFPEANIGTALLLRRYGRQLAVQKIGHVPEPGCFSISIDPNFLEHGVFGLGLQVSPSTAFRPLTTAEATEVETYNIQPSRVFEVAVNERYKDGDELLNSVPPTLSVTVNLDVGARFVTVVHSTNDTAEDLSIEDPIVMKELQEEMDRLSKEAEEETKRQAAAVAEQKRKTDEKTAAERAAAERARHFQNQSFVSGHSIAAITWSAWHIRVYFQDGRGGVRESRHDDGVWIGGDSGSVLFTAKMGTPLSVISWDNGQQSRDSSRALFEAVSDLLACGHVDSCLFPREVVVLTQRNYCMSSGIAATRWFRGALDNIHRNLHIRIYYQDEQSYIRELYWQVGGWSMGGFSQQALDLTPIAAFAWYDQQINIRVFWQDSCKALLESKNANGWAGPSNVANDIDEHCPLTAVELQNGQHHRIYLRDQMALVEKCNGKYGYHWFNGAFFMT